MFPDDAIPVNPEATPDIDTSQLFELIDTGLDPPPIVTTPFDVPVLMLVAKLALLFRFTIPPGTVNASSAPRLNTFAADLNFSTSEPKARPPAAVV